MKDPEGGPMKGVTTGQAPGVKKNKTMNSYANGGKVRGGGAATKGTSFKIT